MNKHKAKGSLKEASGKVLQIVGEVVGSDKQKAEGLAEQAEGKLQKRAGNVKNIFT